MAKYFYNLNTVSLTSCDGIEEVISRRDDENEENTISTYSHRNTTLFPCLNILWLDGLPHIKNVDDGGKRGEISSNTFHVQSQSVQVISVCWSLCQYPTKMFIKECHALSFLIPWYAVEQMKRLQELVIERCERLTDVFGSDANNVDDGSAHSSGVGTPLISRTLRNTTIVVAPQLSNLIRVCIYVCDLLPYIFTFNTLESLKQLKELRVIDCKEIQVIVKEENTGKSSKVVFPHLETLELTDLPKLKGFFLGMNDFRWPSLDNVVINECPQPMMLTSGQSTTPKLKYIRTWFGKYSLECGLNLHGVVNQTTFPNSSSEPTISKGIPCPSHTMIEINIDRGNVGTTIIPSNVLLQLEKLQRITITECNGPERYLK